MKVPPALLFFFAAPSCFFAAPSCLAQTYTLTTLGVPPGYTGSSAKAVNDKGQVTGEINRGTQFSHAFLYDGGKMTDLGTLPGFTDSVGNAINDKGEVAGVATKADPTDRLAPTPLVHAFTTRGGILHDLQPLNQAMYICSGINTAGQVVGGAITLQNQNRAFVYQDSRVTVLDELIVPTAGWKLQEADGINDRGYIVGSGLHDGVLHAFLYHGGEVIDLNHSLPTPTEWVLERAVGINNKGDVVCIGKRGPASHAFLFSSGVMADLGALSGYPNLVEAHLNNSGQVVGEAETAEGTRQCAFLYTDGKLLDLNACIPAEAHWSLAQANGINDNGIIVGTGEHEGKGRAFLLTPKGK